MNKNTKYAKSKGFCSMHDMNTGGDKVFKGSCCDTSWDSPNSNKRGRKVFKHKNDK